MKEQILEIADKLRNGEVDHNEAKILLLSLFGVSGGFISVSDKEPPHNVELLAKSPTGIIHLCSWRSAYNIFTCQVKSETSLDWQWKLV